MIKFDKIELSFDGVKIIEDLTLNIAPTEKVVVLGSSGSGKTSLFSLILGFVKPDRGNIFLEGKPLNAQSVWQVRKRIAYIDQDISLGSVVVSELIDSIFKLKANSKIDFKKADLQNLLEYFELSSNIVDKYTQSLSGGERQRLAIIISILLERKVFLLDEVTSSLDKRLKKKVVDYFLERDDITCLINSHDPEWLKNSKTKIFDVEEKEWKQ